MTVPVIVQWRHGPNGMLMAPRRGQPPVPPEGYEQVPGDAYSIQPKIVACKHRSEQLSEKKCCGGTHKMLTRCDAMDQTVSRAICIACKGRDEFVKLAKGKNL